MDNDTNIDLKKLLASAALEDEKLAEELRNEESINLLFKRLNGKRTRKSVDLREN